MLAFVAFFPDALELVEVILGQAIQRGSLGIPWAVNSLWQTLHRGSNCPEAPAANKNGEIVNLGTQPETPDTDKLMPTERRWLPLFGDSPLQRSLRL